MKNPPAFPSLGMVTPDGIAFEGMTLRDYFAAKALQGIIASYTTSFPEKELAARAAYQYAEAMLKAREN